MNQRLFRGRRDLPRFPENVFSLEEIAGGGLLLSSPFPPKSSRMKKWLQPRDSSAPCSKQQIDPDLPPLFQVLSSHGHLLPSFPFFLSSFLTPFRILPLKWQAHLHPPHLTPTPLATLFERTSSTLFSFSLPSLPYSTRPFLPSPSFPPQQCKYSFSFDSSLSVSAGSTFQTLQRRNAGLGYQAKREPSKLTPLLPPSLFSLSALHDLPRFGWDHRRSRRLHQRELDHGKSVR